MKRGVLWDPGKPIINSFLEQDVYKFLMMYFIWRFYPNLRVKFQFVNRTTDVALRQFIDIEEFQKEYDHARILPPSDVDIAHIRSWGIFPEPFLAFLRTVRLPEVSARYDDDQIDITAEGLWTSATLCEMPTLSIISELYTRKNIGTSLSFQRRAFSEGNARLSEKIKFVKAHPLSWMQFGLRRRATGPWEHHVTERFANEAPSSLVGVSNVRLARDLGVESKGTNAHELQSAIYALNRHISDEAVRMGQYDILDKWEQCFGSQLLIMLTDTFGSRQFIAGLSEKHAVHWKGFRQDSGDPVSYASDLVIPFYKKWGVDPQGKWCFFTDGLDFLKAWNLHKEFRGKIQTGFGIGTNVTNDLGLFKPLSIVMKVVEAAGNPAVKISDNLAKATGPVMEIAEAKRIYKHTDNFYERCRY